MTPAETVAPPRRIRIEPGERARAHHCILSGQCVIQRNDSRRSQIQTLAEGHIAALRSSQHFSALRMRGTTRKFQEFSYARSFFADHADNHARRSHHRDPIERRQNRVPKLERHSPQDTLPGGWFVRTSVAVNRVQSGCYARSVSHAARFHLVARNAIAANHVPARFL